MSRKSKKISPMDAKQHINSENQEHYYYNIVINNNTDIQVPVEFQKTQASAILDNPSQYTLSVIRFQLDTGQLPIFNFTPIPGSPTLGNTNLNKGIYSVSMSFGAQTVQTFVIFHNAIVIRPTPPNITDWFTVNENNFLYYQVFDYMPFINMINSALAECYAMMDTNSPPKLAGAPPPYLDFNPDTHIISLVADKSFNEIYAGPTIKIYMNHNLYQFFHNMNIVFIGYNQPNGTDVLLNVKNLGDNLTVRNAPFEIYPPYYAYTTYAVDELVNFNNINYRSLTAGNLNNQPDISPANWFPEDQPWGVGTVYNKNDTVTYLNNRYRSLTNANIGNIPTAGAPWVLTTSINPPDQWAPATVYTINNIVLYQGFYYISRTNANTGNIPSSSIVNWMPYTGYDSYIMSQEYETLYNWNDITSIVITTSSLPIVSEYIPSLTPVTINGQLLSNQPSFSSRQILTDFAISSTTGFDIKEPITFTNQGEYRLINMISQNPLYQIDVKMYWTNSDNTFFPIFLDAGGKNQANIKLLFRRRLFNQDI